MDAIDLLLTRRSVKAVNLTAPGPSPAQMQTIFRAGMRVPDHGKLAPWKFRLIEGAARERLGELFATIYQRNNPDARESQLQYNRELALRAPVVVAVLSTPHIPHKIPVWEQELSAGAACQNMLIAATAMGYGAQWITEWPAYDPDVLKALGGGETDRIAGFLYFGTATETPADRPRPDYDDIVIPWSEG